MKKLWIIPVLLVFVCMCAVACGPTGAGSVDQDGANIFPTSTKDDSFDIAMGDVMPFYDNGVMNIYHLRNSTGTNSQFYHPIARLTTSDFIHYTDEGIALNFEEKIDSPDAALGTGSFIKDKDGLYHCFYTGHNGNAPSDEFPQLLHTEAVRHATSTDQKHWEKDEDFNLYGYENDFRDPYVYWDETDNTYYMLVTTRDNMAASPSVIRRFKSASLSASDSEWQFESNFFVNDDGDYNMECPSYVEYNGFYYLAYSEQGEGTDRVTHYRYKTSHDDPEWHKFERDSIDAAGFYAGRLEKADGNLYAFAWCARLSGGAAGGFDWGGNLVTHQIKQMPDGELCAVMPDTYKEYFSHEVEYLTVDGGKQSEFTFEGGKFDAVGLQRLSDNVTRISFTMSVEEAGGDFGLTFGLDGDYNKRLGSAALAFEPQNGKLVCYNNVSSILRYGAPLTSVDFAFELDKEYSVDVIIDGEVVTVYLDGTVALTSRVTDMDGNNLAFYSNGAKVTVKDVKFYE